MNRVVAELWGGAHDGKQYVVDAITPPPVLRAIVPREINFRLLDQQDPEEIDLSVTLEYDYVRRRRDGVVVYRLRTDT